MSLCKSQRRRRYVSNETLNDVSVECRQELSVVRLHDALLERRDDISWGCNNDVSSVRLHNVSNKSNVQLVRLYNVSTQQRRCGTSPPSLQVTLSRRLVSRSLLRVQVTLSSPSSGRFPCLIWVSNQTPNFSSINQEGKKKGNLDYKLVELLLDLKPVTYIKTICDTYYVDTHIS